MCGKAHKAKIKHKSYLPNIHFCVLQVRNNISIDLPFEYSDGRRQRVLLLPIQYNFEFLHFRILKKDCLSIQSLLQIIFGFVASSHQSHEQTAKQSRGEGGKRRCLNNHMIFDKIRLHWRQTHERSSSLTMMYIKETQELSFKLRDRAETTLLQQIYETYIKKIVLGGFYK